VVRDKDGVSAALLFADLVSDCTQRGETVVDRLERIYRRHGIHVSSQRNLVLPGLDGAARIEAMMEGLRAEPPRAIGGVEVVRVVDVLLGRDTDPRTGQVDAVDLPTSNVLAFHLADGSRVVARPSGTEPKIKFYFEVREPLGEDEVLEQVEPRAAARMAKLVDDFVPRS